MSRVNPLEIDVLILFCVKGTRLRNISKGVPKALVRINKEPFLCILLNYLKMHGFGRIILCTGYRSEHIEQYVGQKNFGKLKLLISCEKEVLGTAGAIKNAEKMILSQYIIVINGDTFLELDYFNFIQFFFAKKAAAVIALTKTREAAESGIVKLNSRDNIVYYGEKINASVEDYYINAGVYLFDKEILDYIEPRTKMSLEYDVFPQIVKSLADRMLGFYSPGIFIDIGTPKNFDKAQQLLKPFQSVR